VSNNLFDRIRVNPSYCVWGCFTIFEFGRCDAASLVPQPRRFWMAARPADAPKAGDKHQPCALEMV
jgi:hypothetical protein